MRILHYFLGFPPYRTGGLTKYAFDLMKAQAQDGNVILALWPGEIKKIGSSPKIKERKQVQRINNFELINPLPVSLDEGINNISSFTKKCDINIYIQFLKTVKPDVIHIHTFMGIHKEFITAANQLHIRTVMTAHDYFGICPKVTLYRFGECCDNDNGCRNCIQCNLNALSLTKIQLMQSPLYRMLKDNVIIKKLRKQHRSDFFFKEKLPPMPKGDLDALAKDYGQLRTYYIDMFESIDFMHFNSTVTEEIYKRYMIPKTSKVISITHHDIKVHKKSCNSNKKKIILYLAPSKPFKGYNILKEALDRLWVEKKIDFELRIYSPVKDPSPYMVVKDEGYSYHELGKVMSEADMLVAPSIWYETFGFTVLEALSYQVPVIVSDRVGAKDIVGDNGLIVKAGNVEELMNAICSLDKNVSIKIKSWKQFLAENYEMYEDTNIVKK